MSDIRSTAHYRATEAVHAQIRAPGQGRVSDGAELSVSPCATAAVLTVTIAERLEGDLSTRIGRVSLEDGTLTVLTGGSGTDRLPKYSPDGDTIAFLSDRHQTGAFQLYFHDLATGELRPAPHVDGWVEYYHWSPDGQSILFAVAGHGADVAGGQGAIASAKAAVDTAPWMPEVDEGEEVFKWRSLHLLDIERMEIRPLSREGSNIWEAAYCGPDKVVAVRSSGTSEGTWYGAGVVLVDTADGRETEIHCPLDQVGCLAGQAEGDFAAFVTAVCSDRWIVAGELEVFDVRSGRTQKVATPNIDVTFVEWISTTDILITGHRNLETVVGIIDTGTWHFRELWSSSERTTSGFYARVCALSGSAFAMIGEGFLQPPEVAVVRDGVYQPIASLNRDFESLADSAKPREVHWHSHDGQEVSGWFLEPVAPAPFPVVMIVHGGPIAHWRPQWLGRRGVYTLMLLRQGYGVFLPNPRGSSGKGKEFARAVLGDMGGADAADLLTGIDHLVATDLADPNRLGVMGGSYGGYMSAWLITQTRRFAAAIPMAPVINLVTEHFLSNIPHFVEIFAGDEYTNTSGKYYSRSPLMHVRGVTTPSLNVCGALDKCTPPAEAAQFHNALMQSGATSTLVTYPLEGHGIRKYPAMIDFAARALGWFARFMPADRASGQSH